MSLRTLSLLLRPHYTVLLAISVSAICWLVPGSPSLRKGYEEAEPLTLIAFTVLFLWYGLIVVMAWMGFTAGRNLPRLRAATTGPDDPRTYLIFSIISLSATCAVYYRLYETGILIRYLTSYSSMSANVLRDSLYEDYHIGIYSLRYLVSLSGAIAAYRMLSKGRVTVLDAVNVASLLLISALSSRLTMMLAAFTVVGMFTAAPLAMTVAAKRRIAGGVLFFVAMIWIYNYSRNIWYYSTHHNDGFLLAGISEIVAYLGGPMNVAIGVGNHWTEAVNGVDPATYVTYDFVRLTTNSALADLVPKMGYLAFIYIAAQSLVYGAITGWCSEQRYSPVFLAFPLISYGFYELCRVNVLGMGIMFCLIGCATLVPILTNAFLRPSRRNVWRRVGNGGVPSISASKV
jgi:hypothetical protein